MDYRWPRHYDTLFLGAVAGLAGSAVRNLLELAAIAFIPRYTSCARLAGAIHLEPKCVMTEAGAYLVGLEIDLLVGIAVGIVAVLILSAWGLDRLPIKGAIGGALTWLLFFVCLSHPLSRMTPSTYLVETQISLAIHIVFGLTVVWSAREIDRRGAGRKTGQGG